MKRIICLITALILVFSLAACGSKAPAVASDGDAAYYASDGDAWEDWGEEEPNEGYGSFQPDNLLEGMKESDYPDYMESEPVEVSNTDEFLAALNSDTVIVLKAGDYVLSDASDYGTYYEDGPYTWMDLYDGDYELVIRDLENLTIYGDTQDNSAARIMVKPRYANVLSFNNCKGLNFSCLTSGHTEAPGFCSGGVWNFTACKDINIFGCRLYGCGTLGVSCTNCRYISVDHTDIYDCSNGAAYFYNCYDARFDDSRFSGCGKSSGGAYTMFYAASTTGLAFVNCKAEQNICEKMFETYFCDDMYLLGSEFKDNAIANTFFAITGTSPVIDKCSFKDDCVLFEETYSDGEIPPYGLSPDGEKLYEDELRAMELSAAEYDGPSAQEGAGSGELSSVPAEEYHVSTVDEFLAAIGPDRTIYLEAEMFDLSTASNYGGFSGGDWYVWEQFYDGPNLRITGVSNLRIEGLGKDKTTVMAVPRYANVLSFSDCSNIVVSDLTAGHMKEAPGSCSGSVLGFFQCRNFHVVDCGLFGCGVYGLDISSSTRGDVLSTEIYDCSEGAAYIYSSDGIAFTGCNIHDCGENGDYFTVYSSGDITLNDTSLIF